MPSASASLEPGRRLHGTPPSRHATIFSLDAPARAQPRAGLQHATGSCTAFLNMEPSSLVFQTRHISAAAYSRACDYMPPEEFTSVPGLSPTFHTPFIRRRDIRRHIASASFEMMQSSRLYITAPEPSKIYQSAGWLHEIPFIHFA